MEHGVLCCDNSQMIYDFTHSRTNNEKQQSSALDNNYSMHHIFLFLILLKIIYHN